MIKENMSVILTHLREAMVVWQKLAVLFIGIMM